MLSTLGMGSVTGNPVLAATLAPPCQSQNPKFLPAAAAVSNIGAELAVRDTGATSSSASVSGEVETCATHHCHGPRTAVATIPSAGWRRLRTTAVRPAAFGAVIECGRLWRCLLKIGSVSVFHEAFAGRRMYCQPRRALVAHLEPLFPATRMTASFACRYFLSFRQMASVTSAEANCRDSTNPAFHNAGGTSKDEWRFTERIG